tara:strand:+ start:1224 stop:1592 length:369 start_codon:yes stop_codon:yes gene_type:complete
MKDKGVTNLDGKHCPNSAPISEPSKNYTCTQVSVNICTHEWKKEVHSNNLIFFCEHCGAFRNTQPEDYVEVPDDDEKEEFSKCRHEWICLGDRCHHAKGKAGGKKYKAYKCELCGKFQRRTS